jgi:hypothetical protein
LNALRMIDRKPFCFRDHVAEEYRVFHAVDIVRTGIDGAEPLQELLQKCFRCLSENWFCCRGVGKGFATGCEFKTDSANTVLGSNWLDKPQSYQLGQ